MTLLSIILQAIQKVQLNDELLIQKKMEWATAHRLALYLEEHFPGWDVDCEYNKVGTEINSKHDSSGTHRRPDIIVHKRERLEKDNNLLVIEIKMESDDSPDEQKIIDFTSPPTGERPFQYQIGLKISFLPMLKLKWFKGGQEIENVNNFDNIYKFSGCQ